MNTPWSDEQPTRAGPIRVRADVRVLQGYLYGSPQPLVLLTAGIQGDPVRDLAGLDEAVRSLAAGLPYAPQGSGTPGLAARIGELSAAVQSHFAHPICSFRETTSLGTMEGRSTFRVKLPCHDSQAAVQVVGWAIRALNILVEDPHNVEKLRALSAELARLGEALRNRASQDLNTGNFIRSAWKLGIPVSRLVGSIYRFGQGARSRLLDSSFTDRTRIIAAKIAGDKPATAHVLRDAGLPVPDHLVVRSLETALKAAAQLGFPVVIKPTGEEGGRGVFAGLRDERALAAAAAEAFKLSKNILVERHFHGADFRLTVFESQVVKVEQRIAAGVVGDGRSTVGELIAAAQASPRMQNILHQRGKMVVALDDEAIGLLEEQGFTAATVLKAGQRAAIRRKNNVSAGGEQIGVAVGKVHPDNLALAIRAAELLDLDLAGIDLLIPDIFTSWLESGAAICEVNARPQIGVRTSPEIYAEILQIVFEDRGRIPLYLLVTKDGDSLPVRTLEGLAERLSCNAFASADGAWVDGKPLVAGPLSAFGHFRNLLAHRRVEAAVGVMSVGEIGNTGLPTAYFDTIFDLAGDGFAGFGDALAPHARRLSPGLPHA